MSKSFDVPSFIESAKGSDGIKLPPSLSPAERAWLHEFSEKHNLSHVSSGDGPTRCLTVSKSEAGGTIIDVPSGSKLTVADIKSLCKALFSAEPAGLPTPKTPKHRAGVIGEAADASAVARGDSGSKSPLASLPLDVTEFTNRAAKALQEEKSSEIATATDAAEPSVAISKAAGTCLAPVVLEESFVSTGGERMTFVTAAGGSAASAKAAPPPPSKGGKGKKGATAAPSNGAAGTGGAASGDPLPAHRISVHDVVCIRPLKNTPARADGARGLVTKVTPMAITIAVDPDGAYCDLSGSLRIDKLANEVTFERMGRTLTDLSMVVRGTFDPSGRGQSLVGRRHIIDAMFRRPDAPDRVRCESATKINFFNANLDDSQRAAVALAAHSDTPFALVHGPPGTGKTTAVIEIILQHIITHKRRVLVAAASNIAVDTIVERLVSAGGNGRRFTTVRYGHPARLLEAVVECSLESLCNRHPSSRDTAVMRRELRDVSQTIDRKSTTTKERNDAFKTRRQLTSDIRAVERGIQDEVLDRAECVAATLTGVATGNISRLKAFDVVIIDESAQATEVAALAAVLRGQLCILAGDHLQLPPTVVSDEAVALGLGVTLFERLMRSEYAGTCSAMLTTQYRMNDAIMRWSSDALYGGLLEAHASVADHTLATGDGPLLLIDTSGCGDEYEEEILEDGLNIGSVSNEGEAKVAISVVKHLLDGGVAPADIGVISPYNAQVAKLVELRTRVLGRALGGSERELEISTVDGFQGREKEAIIITLCRSNEDKNVGFVGDFRRLNVAVTRARKFVCVIGDTETLRNSETLASLIDYMEAAGEVASAMEWDRL